MIKVGYCDMWKVRKMYSRNVMSEYKITNVEQ